MALALAYLDSSALVKLVLNEPESSALFEAIQQFPYRVSSSLAITEVQRTVRRASEDPLVLARARTVLGGTQLLALDEALLERAAALAPAGLRSLDAIHLASALVLGPDLDAFIAYDRRLLAAASELGLNVLAPATQPVA